MELINFLIEAQKERFKAAAAVEAITKKIIEKVEREMFEKYKNKTLFDNGMEFELIGVTVYFSIWEDYLHVPDVDLSLVFFCKSKLPKIKREKLESVKKRYKETKHLEWSNHKNPLWMSISYDVELEKLLSGKLNLDFNKN